MSARDDDRADRVSVPFRCKHCGWNDWHVFQGGRDGATTFVRLHCANQRCPDRSRRMGSCVVRRWLSAEG